MNVTVALFVRDVLIFRNRREVHVHNTHNSSQIDGKGHHCCIGDGDVIQSSYKNVHQETSIFYFKSHFLLYCYHIHFSTAQYKVDCAIHFSISESILDIFFSAPHLHSKFSLHAPNIYPNNQLRQFNRYPIKLIFIDFTYLNIMTLNPQFQIEFSFL